MILRIRSVANVFIDSNSIASEAWRIYNESGSIYTRCIKNWEMTKCRPLVVPGESTTVELPEEEEPDVDEILRAQKLQEL